MNLTKRDVGSTPIVGFLMFGFFVLVFLWTAAGAAAGVRYLDANSASPSPPYTNWASAARVIQEVIDAAAPGDELLVANGTYASGGRAVGDGWLGQPAVGTLARRTSDQDQFWSVGLPAVLIEGLGAAPLHTTDDTLAALDFDYFQAMVQAIVGTAAHLASPTGRNPMRPPVMGPVVVISGGAVKVTLTGVAGRTCAIQASRDLAYWLTITNLTLTANTAQFLDTFATNFSQRFYRARFKGTSTCTCEFHDMASKS